MKVKAFLALSERKQDAVVSEKVMGVPVVAWFGDEPCYYVDGSVTKSVPRYTEDIADAFQVVDRITDIDGPYGEHKWSFGMEFSHVIDWVVDFTPRRNHPKSRKYPAYQAQSGSRAHAICLAALKAVGAIE